MRKPKILSLFSGPGGLDLGFRKAGYDIALAVDISQAAIETHKRNFPKSTALAADLTALGPSGLLEEFAKVVPRGSRIAVIGGPPCQGFSRANTSSSTNDPRNALPFLYLQIIELLQRHYVVEFVLFENVLGIRDAKHAATFAGILGQLRKLGLSERVSEFSALDFGVPQVRRRIVICAFRSSAALASFKPTFARKSGLTVQKAIGGLPEPAYFSAALTSTDIPYHPNHWTMNPRSARFSNDGQVRAGTRSFRQLSWDKPSPTVAYGNREIHVHPNGKRRLSIFEAMKLQGFPEDFVLEGNLSAQVQQVSNAVPPPMAFRLACAVSVALNNAE